MASKNKQERRRQRAKEVSKEYQRRQCGARIHAQSDGGGAAQSEEGDECWAIIENMLGGPVFRIGQSRNPKPIECMAKAIKADDEGAFCLSVWHMRQQKIDIFKLKVFAEDGGLAMDVFEYAICCGSRKVFCVLALLARSSKAAFGRMLDLLSYCLEQSDSWDLKKDFEAWVFAETVRGIIRAGIEGDGPWRAGQCGKIWDAVAIEVEAEQQQEALSALIPEVDRGDAAPPQVGRL